MDSSSIIVSDEDFGCKHVHVAQWAGDRTSVGWLIMGEDGMWSYWPDVKRNGGFPGWFLKAVADKIFELNEPMEKSIEEYFQKETGEQNDKAD